MSTVGPAALRELIDAVRTGGGRGVVALFTGEGAVQAAESAARGLGAGLRRLDAESQAARDLAASESGGVVLLEGAGAVEPSDLARLLERVESRPGLVVLAANLGDHLDERFLRRIRFVFHFPFPDSGERDRLWERG